MDWLIRIQKLRKHAKDGTVFGERIEPKHRRGKASSLTQNPSEVPSPMADVGAAPSESEVSAVESRVKPPQIRKRTLDLKKKPVTMI
jgi:hypothetical protein